MFFMIYLAGKNNFLDFSKLEAGKLALENIPFDFQETLEEVVSLQATSAHEKGLEVTLKVDSKIPTGVVGDPLRIQQVLTNLVGNSIKFTERGNIDISVEMRSQKDDIIEFNNVLTTAHTSLSSKGSLPLILMISQPQPTHHDPAKLHCRGPRRPIRPNNRNSSNY